MQTQPFVEFRWDSLLGVSVILFLMCGLLYLSIGALSALLINSKIGDPMLIISSRTDSIVFGRSPTEILRDDPALFKLRTILVIMLGGLMFAAGWFHLAITWFGLRQGQFWALAVLAIGGVAVLPFWFLALQPYLRHGVNLGLADTPPFMWVPALLLLPATILGWIAIK